jgi:hypothetical protein
MKGTKPVGSGRKKGTPNKKKLLRVDELLAEKNINPVEKALELMPELAPHQQIKVWMELASYCFPKPREDAQSLQAQLVQVVQQLPADWQKAIEAGEPLPSSESETSRLFGVILDTAPEQWLHDYMQGRTPPKLIIDPNQKD